MTPCSHKRRYPDELTALASGAYASQVTGNQDLYVYPCKHCHGWHLTRRRRWDGRVLRWIFNYG